MKSFQNKCDHFLALFMSVTENHNRLPNKVCNRLNGSELCIEDRNLTFIYDDFIIVVRDDEIKIGDGSSYFIKTRPIQTNENRRVINKQVLFYRSITFDKHKSSTRMISDPNAYWCNGYSYEFDEGTFEIDGIFNLTLEGGPRIPVEIDAYVKVVKRICDMTGINFYG